MPECRTATGNVVIGEMKSFHALGPWKWSHNWHYLATFSISILCDSHTCPLHVNVCEIGSGKEETSLSRRQHLASLHGVRNQEAPRHINSRGLLTLTSYKIGSGFSLAVVLSAHIWWNVLLKLAYLTACFLSSLFFFFFWGDRFFIICWIHFTLSIFYRKMMDVL